MAEFRLDSWSELCYNEENMKTCATDRIRLLTGVRPVVFTKTGHRDRHRVTHRHFVTAWMAVKTPHKVNAKTNLFSRKRDAEGVVPYRHTIIFVNSHHMYKQCSWYMYIKPIAIPYGTSQQSPCHTSAFCYRMDGHKESRMGYKQNMRNSTKSGRRGRRPLRTRNEFCAYILSRIYDDRGMCYP